VFRWVSQVRKTEFVLIDDRRLQKYFKKSKIIFLFSETYRCIVIKFRGLTLLIPKA